MDDYLKELRAIDTNNYFISYLIERVQKDDYRGHHFSQHYRKDMGLIIDITESIKKNVGDDFFEIPRGDFKNYKHLLSSDFPIFTKIVESIKRKSGKVKHDSLKKILLVDLQRMGFIDRFDKNKNITFGGQGRTVYYGKLTKVAIDFLQGNLLKRYQILTDGLNIYFGNFLSDIIKTIYYSDLRNEKISIYELMFILTDKDEYLNKYKLIRSFRDLKKDERSKVIKLLKKYAVPKRFKGNKKSQRDFHNWKNQSQDILTLFKTTIYFEADSKGFKLNVGNLGIFDGTSKRSDVIKDEYFIKHNTIRTKNFELHHVIPIKKAKTKGEFKLIDDYRNLIYLNKNKHKTINDTDDIIVNISDYFYNLFGFSTQKSISMINGKDVYFNPKLKKVITKYNLELLKVILNLSKKEIKYVISKQKT